MSDAQSTSILSHVFSMPSWHKMVLTISMLFAGGGTLGSAVDYFSPDQSAQVTTQPSEASPPAPEKPWLTHKVSPWAMRVGLACIGGFVIGFIFRLFLKIMTLLTLAVMTILVALSYFNVMNIDFTAVEKKYESGAAWVTGQAEIASKKLASHLPGSGSGFLGMFMGFRRRKLG
jgi:uncharacterized membrane protein (Fun14 family)